MNFSHQSYNHALERITESLQSQATEDGILDIVTRELVNSHNQKCSAAVYLRNTNKLFVNNDVDPSEKLHMRSCFSKSGINSFDEVIRVDTEEPHRKALESRCLFHLSGKGKCIIPLIYKNKVLGTLDIYYNEPFDFCQEAKEFVHFCSTYISMILDRRVRDENLNDLIKETEALSSYLNQSNLISETDERGVIKYVNSLFCKISGYTNRELIGKPHAIVNSGYHTKEFWEDFWRHLKAGEVWRGEVCNKRKDGTIYWVHTHVFPKKDLKGKTIGYVSIRQDITRAKERELQLHREREQRIEDSRLMNLGLIAAGIGHEINNPLAIGFGYTRNLERKLIDQGLMDSETEEFFKHIHDAHDRIKSIAKDIKSFARKKSLNFNLRSLKYSLQDAFDVYKPGMGEELPSNVIFDGSLENLQILVDEESFQKIITNLLRNSLQAYEREGASEELTIKMYAEEFERDIVLYFEDNGPGIPECEREKIFDFFYSTRGPREGTGLGLALCKELCHRMKSKIELVPSQGAGAIFKLTFPKVNANTSSTLY